MQPLTPNERRSLEHLIMLLRSKSGKAISAEEIIPQDTEYWLKVLSMALEHNEALEENWRKR